MGLQIDPEGLLYRQLPHTHRAYRIVSLSVGFNHELATYIADGMGNVVASELLGLLGVSVKETLNQYSWQSGILVVRMDSLGITNPESVFQTLRILKLPLRNDPIVEIFGVRKKFIFLPLNADVVEKFFQDQGVVQDTSQRANSLKARE